MKENNKEIKERLLKAHTLSNKELEQVTGGTSKIVTSLEGLSCKSRDSDDRTLGSDFYYNNKHYICSSEYTVIGNVLCMIYKSEETGDPIMIPYY